ncbi:hypothetical protein G6F35_016234 [Rhizopus arrhizus]|nr:hypothetical protein G6F35_016234 [Rhizopus arrhizus]
MAVMRYAFREREELMDCYEAVSGARMHATYYRPGGVYRDLPDQMPKYKESCWKKGKELRRLNAAREGSLLDFIENFTREFPNRIDEYETLLTDNRIWKQRTVGIGVVSPQQAMDWGMTGVMLRGSGVAWDLRKKRPYAKYDAVDFDIPVGSAVQPHHPPMCRLASRQPRPGDGPELQGGAAVPAGDEVRHGSADPSLQALQRRLPGAGR